MIAGFMGLLDVSIVAVALPSMQKSLHTSDSSVQWVVSGYALAFGLALVPAGRLGDSWGRRRIFLLSLAGFVATSALCGAAPSLSLLVAARLLQGLVAGMLGPQNSGLIQDLFRGEERARAFGLYGASVGLSQAVGPIVGGAILGLFGEPEGWRWIFYVNVPIGLAALLVAPRVLPGRRPEQIADRTPVSRRLDPMGTALLGVAVLAVLVPLLEYRLLSRLWWLFAVSAVVFALFFRWEKRVVRLGRREPLLNPALLTSIDGYASGTALGVTYFIGFSGLFMVLALYFQYGLGYSPLRSGLAVTSFALGSSVSSALAGRVVVRWGRWLTVTGLCAVVVGLLLCAAFLRTAPGTSAGWWAAAPLLLAGIGTGVVISPNLTLTLTRVPVRMAGAAGAALQTGQRVGSAVGTALVAGIYYGVTATSGPGEAIFAALLCATGFVVLALVIAVWDLWRRRPGTGSAAARAAELADVDAPVEVRGVSEVCGQVREAR
jgi:EmrB/QacA subfamily drug resistance transporter